MIADLPPLPLEPWRPTRDTLHLYVQIVGKIRLGLMPRMNHWWHVTLYVTPRGLTTGPMPAGDRALAIDFDLVDHALVARTSAAEERRVELADGLSVAEFYLRTMAALDELSTPVSILARPYLHPTSEIPFAEDREHDAYDAEAVDRFRRALIGIEPVLWEFRGRFLGKSTPVHLFWHSFDLALTRFSGRPAPPLPEGANPRDREAYSHEVVSFGFWAGDDKIPEPAFYSYTFPAPDGLAGTRLEPDAAAWGELNASPMALLPYAAVRSADDPRAALLGFLESAYRAGAGLAGWDVDALALPPPAR